MACTLNTALGKADCNANYGDPKMLGISNTKISYANYEAAQAIASVQALIEEDATYFVTPNFTSFDSTNSEPVTETDGYGRDRDTRNTPGSDLFYLDSNPCDFNNYVNSINKGSYYIEVFFSNNYKLLTKKSDGTLEPLKGQVNAVPVGVPSLDNKIQQYRLKINWDNVEQMENVVLVQLVDDLIDYQELMPVGWSWDWNTAYAATARDIKIWERCDRTSLMTQTPTARLIDWNVDTPAVTAGAPTLGVSTLTITKAGTPVALVAGDYIKFVLEFKTGAVVDYTTDVITFKV